VLLLHRGWKMELIGKRTEVDEEGSTGAEVW